MAFKYAGVSTNEKGNTKVRFANDQMRIKVMAKGGHTNINLLELPSDMDKPEIVAWLKTTALMENDLFRSAIEEADEKYNSVKTKRTSTVKATKKVKSADETLADLKARAAAVTSE